MLSLFDAIVSLWPRGAAGNIEPDGDLYKTFQAMADNHETVRLFLEKLAYIREPKLTPYLSDLEKEYGLLTNSSLTEQERRDYLHGIVYATPSPGTHEYLEYQLQNAGFNVQVHVNSPAVDPGRFYGGAGGEMVTNNILYERTIQEARDDRNVWSFVFVIGGDAIRDEVTDELLAVAPIIIPDNLRVLFRELVLKYKPLHSWGIAVINDEDYFTLSPDPDLIIVDAPRGLADDEQTIGGWCWEFGLSDTFIIDDYTFEFVAEIITGVGPTVTNYLKDE